jgi:hypothetical protein
VVDGNEFAFTIAEKDGLLRLSLPREYSGRRQWNEGPRGSLESRLGDVLAELERRAE